MFSLAGKKALIVGIANEDSIAFGCAKAFRAQGAELAVTFPNEKSERFVRPVAEKLAADIILPLDVRRDEQFRALTEAIGRRWERIDICLHAVAFCPKADLHAPVTDCSRDGFAVAMDISVYSFIRLVRETALLMSAGGACMTVSFLGAEKVIEHYNIMGPVKAALEAATRYMAAELGPKGIRVHALSPGPLKTRRLQASVISTSFSRPQPRGLQPITSQPSMMSAPMRRSWPAPKPPTSPAAFTTSTAAITS